jgi:ferredoxin-NADP reductase
MTENLHTLVVTDRRQEADGVISLALRGSGLPPWEPGAHLDFLLAHGLERQYSLCGDPAEQDVWRIAVLREPEGRGGSAFVHERLWVGETVRVRGPRNDFPLRPAGRYLFIAGGIGITPILPMLRAADAASADWSLLYGGRTRGSMAFRDQLTRYGERVAIRPQDETGLLDLASYLGPPGPDTAVYCCGPGALLEAVEQYCAANGLPEPRMERFRPKAREASPDTPFELVLARSGLTLSVPEHTSVLETGVSDPLWVVWCSVWSSGR